jgi:hypothetical protein
MQHAIEVQVINELASAAQQTQILDAFNRLTDIGVDRFHGAALPA